MSMHARSEMIRRPQAGDTEEDLLSLQESFLASGELPSAAFLGSKQAPPPKKKVQVGEKRRDHGGEEEMAVDEAVLQERDVVQLHPGGV